MKLRGALIWIAALLLCGGAKASPIQMLSFDDVGLTHGSVVSNQYADRGVTISAVNRGALGSGPAA